MLYFAGANSFGFYAVKIFRQTFAGLNPHGGAIAVAFVQLLAAMLSGLLIDTVGRIPLLIVSSVFMSLALASFGSYVYYEQSNKLIASTTYDMDAAASVNTDWIPLLCVLVFTIAFSLGKQKLNSTRKPVFSDSFAFHADGDAINRAVFFFISNRKKLIAQLNFMCSAIK